MKKTNRRHYTEADIHREIMEVASQFEPVRMPSVKELNEYYGNTCLSNKLVKDGGMYYWAKKLGLETKRSETKIGLFAERHVAKLLEDMGFQIEMTSSSYPYDLLIDGCVKVDVKAAKISYVHDCPIRAYRLAKKQQTCDFYIFCEVDEEEQGRNIDTIVSGIYVVPASKLTGNVQVEMGVASTKYEKYKNRFDLIDKAVTFYKTLAV